MALLQHFACTSGSRRRAFIIETGRRLSLLSSSSSLPTTRRCCSSALITRLFHYYYDNDEQQLQQQKQQQQRSFASGAVSRTIPLSFISDKTDIKDPDDDDDILYRNDKVTSMVSHSFPDFIEWWKS